MTVTFYDPQAFQDGLDGASCSYAVGGAKYDAYEAGEREATEIVSEWSKCAMCGGPLTELGTLGRTTHYRCRDCGYDCSESETNSVLG